MSNENDFKTKLPFNDWAEPANSLRIKTPFLPTCEAIYSQATRFIPSLVEVTKQTSAILYKATSSVKLTEL